MENTTKRIEQRRSHALDSLGAWRKHLKFDDEAIIKYPASATQLLKMRDRCICSTFRELEELALCDKEEREVLLGCDIDALVADIVDG